ncbi:MAG: hypothetical protein U0271_34190 [Polyangiaceae bacterium]
MTRPRVRYAAPANPKTPDPGIVAAVRSSFDDATFAAFVAELKSQGYDTSSLDSSAPSDAPAKSFRAMAARLGVPLAAAAQIREASERDRQRAEIDRRMNSGRGPYAPAIRRTARGLEFSHVSEARR